MDKIEWIPYTDYIADKLWENLVVACINQKEAEKIFEEEMKERNNIIARQKVLKHAPEKKILINKKKDNGR